MKYSKEKIEELINNNDIVSITFTKDIGRSGTEYFYINYEDKNLEKPRQGEITESEYDSFPSDKQSAIIVGGIVINIKIVKPL